jgi:hypothetical protein
MNIQFPGPATLRGQPTGCLWYTFLKQNMAIPMNLEKLDRLASGIIPKIAIPSYAIKDIWSANLSFKGKKIFRW